MKKLLVLIDFSGPSLNAAAYAAALAQDRGFDEILLMANCYRPLFEQILPSPDLVQEAAADTQLKVEKSLRQLLELKLELQKQLSPDFPIGTILGEQPLLRGVLEQVEQQAPALVVIGSSARALEEDCSIGRRLIPLVKVLTVPVLVIPQEARYQPIKDVLVAGTAEPRESLSPLLGDLHYLSYTPQTKDVLRDVLDAAAGRKVQLIVALPRKHSFFYNLTHQNIMNGIVMNAAEPVLILK